MSKATEGGMTSPMAAAAARTATDSDGRYPRWRNGSFMTLPTVATSATFDPLIPENTYIETIEASSRPPGQCPTHS